MMINAQTIIGQLVAEDYRTAMVFKNRGIDFCCNGNRSIGDAGAAAGVEVQELINVLNNAVQLQSTNNIDYNSWPLDLLADYIEKKHHRYVRAKIEEIPPFLNKIARVHAVRHPELIEVEQLFNETAQELSMHMQKEERVIFPFIRQMIANGKQPDRPAFGSIQNPIKMMMQEHEDEGERLSKIAALTGQYRVPQDGCSTYSVSLAMLKEFEEDLHLHIHLENNILFPKTIAMEQA